MPTVFEDLQWRGSVHQLTDPAVAELLNRGELPTYGGFDPTADSLQLGNLVLIVALMRVQSGGNRIIALAGGGTGMVGDPGGKSEERTLLTDDELKANLAGIRTQLERFIDFDNAVMVDNGDWLWKVGLLEFLRDIGKHFTVNSMIAKESVKARIQSEHGISYTEFSYMLLQAYDFLQLFDREGCRLQLGGSDQWGNIVSGVDLIRRVRGEQSFGLTFPLVTDAEGRKLGKTEHDTVWLDAQRTSPYAMYQYLVRVDDERIGPYLRWLTFLDHDAIEGLERGTRDAPEKREGQRALALEVTALVHGSAAADQARMASDVLFSTEIAGLDEGTLVDVLSEAPSSDRPRGELTGGVVLVDLLAETGLCSSKSDARRQLGQKAIYVNNVQVTDPDRVLTGDDLLHDRYVILRRGRKQQHLLAFRA